MLFHHPTQRIPVVLKNGQIGTIAASEAESVFKDGGRVASPEEYQKAAVEERQGGIAGTGEAAAAGFGRGLGMGLTDPIAVGGARVFGGKAYAEKVRTKLAELKQAHPYVSFGSEMLGAVAPALATGGESAAEEAPSLVRAGVEAKGALGAAKAAEGPAAKAVTEAGKVFENPSLPAGNIVPATDEAVALHNPALRANDNGIPHGPTANDNGLPRPANDTVLPGNDNGLPAASDDNGLPGGAPSNDNALPAPPARDWTIDRAVVPHPQTGLPTEAYVLKKGGVPVGQFDSVEAAYANMRAAQPAAVPPTPDLKDIIAKLPPEMQEAAKLPPAPPGAQIPHAAAEQLGVAGHETIQQAGEYAASRIDEMAQHTSNSFGVRDVLRNTPAGLTSRAGRFAEDMADGAVKELFGEEFGNTGAGRVISSAIRLGASGAMEGGLFAVGNEISEDTLGDVDLNAEKLMATFGHGALLGSAFGFGAGAAGGVAKEGASSLLKMLAPKLTDLSRDMMFRAFGAGGGRSPAAKEALHKWGADGIRILTDVVPKYGLLDGAADIETIFDRTMNSVKGVGKEIGDIRGGADAIAERSQLPKTSTLFNNIKSDLKISDMRQYGGMHRMIVGLTKDEELELNSLPKIIADKREAAVKIERTLREKEQMATQLGQQFDRRLARETIKNAKMGLIQSIRRQSQLNRLWDSSELGKIQRVVMDLGDKDGRVTFTKLASWRAHLDDQITTWGKSAAMGDPYGSMRALFLKSARGGAEDTLVSHAEGVIGKEKMARYLELKADYQKLRFLEKKAESSLAAKYNNHQVALTTKLLGLTFLGHGNPVMAVASMAGHKLIRDRGAAATALVLEKMSQLAFIQRAVAKADGAVEKAIDGVIGRASGKEVRAAQRVRGRLRVRGFSTRDTTAATPEEHRTNGADHLKHVGEMANLPNLEDEHVSGALGGASSYAPKHVSSVASAANMATQYLVSKLPQGHDSTQEIASGPARISDLELHDFQHHVEGATDAIKVLHKIGNGTASPTHIEAFKKTHPLMYTELRNKVAERLATLRPNVRESMSMQVQSELAALFAMPVTWAQTPAGMKLLQANDIQITQSDGRPTQPQKPGRMAPSRLKTDGADMQTDIDRIDGKGIGEH